MDHEQDCLPYSTDPVPTLLTADHAGLAKHQSSIGEYARCGLNLDAGVLLLV
jgi:hypothetical protein